jgi:hypothetical protein
MKEILKEIEVFFLEINTFMNEFRNFPDNYKQKEKKMAGPRILLKYPPDLETVVAKPTGQGFGAARKGPAVKGPITDAVVDEDYQQGKSFKIED